MAQIGLLVCGVVTPVLQDAYPTANEDFFVKVLQRHEPSLNFRFYQCLEGDVPSDAQECDGWLMTGSSHGAYERLDWMLKLEDLIRDAYAQGVPLAGICFGHQLMAQALGGKVEKVDTGWGLGAQRYRLHKPIVEGDGAEAVTLLAIHQDQVVVAPDDAEVIASTDHCPNAGLHYEGAAISLQPHPEFPVKFERDLLQALRGVKLDLEQVDRVVAEMDQTPVHSDQVMGYIAKFLATGKK